MSKVRFWERVDRPSPTACWTWRGAHIPDGYGQVVVDGRRVGTHRYAYELLVGPIPDGLQIDHLCRNPGCCNPAHLEPVTRKENIRRGRSSPGLHAQQTHCIYGHPLAGDNLRIKGRGERSCRVCTRRRAREYKERQTARLREEATA